MDLTEIREYLELIDTQERERLFKVFEIFNKHVEISENEISIYNFHKEHYKELVVLEELDIIEWYWDEDENCHQYETNASQIDMARIKNIFKEFDPIGSFSNYY